ncbi:MAG: hypothetical protein ACLFVS_03580 [Candidatus Acetothermia bacterium]|nr:hypothetical protein [Candidatus Bipolaricaulota bacterium]
MVSLLSNNWSTLILAFLVAVLGKLIDWVKAQGYPRILVLFMEVVLLGLVVLMGYSVYLLFV